MQDYKPVTETIQKHFRTLTAFEDYYCANCKLFVRIGTDGMKPLVDHVVACHSRKAKEAQA